MNIYLIIQNAQYLNLISLFKQFLFSEWWNLKQDLMKILKKWI